MTRNHVIALQFSLQGGKKDSIRGNHPKNLMHHGNKVSSQSLQKPIGSCAHKTVQTSKTQTETHMMYCRKWRPADVHRYAARAMFSCCVLSVVLCWSMDASIHLKGLFSLTLFFSQWVGRSFEASVLVYCISYMHCMSCPELH